jgi:hypothetical protein
VVGGRPDVAGAAQAQKTTLIVYTAIETDQLNSYQTAFAKAEPSIRAEVGARLDRRDHGETHRGEGEPQLGLTAQSASLFAVPSFFVAFHDAER